MTYQQRQLKMVAMMNSLDLRGSRRLYLMCDVIGQVRQIHCQIVIVLYCCLKNDMSPKVTKTSLKSMNTIKLILSM